MNSLASQSIDAIKEAYSDYRTRKTCRLCSGSLTKVLDLGETCLANELPDAPIEGGQTKFPLYLCRCDDCGHVQLPVVVNPERLFRHYVYQSGTSPVFVQHLKDFARDVQPKPGGFVVEVGSNDGTLLAEYKKLGFEVLGIDPASNIADIAELENQVPTLRCFFGKDTLRCWHLAGRKADLVIANNVFAHANDLAEIADAVALLLADDGVFVMECGYLPDVIAKGLYRVVYHEHLSHHHLRPLQKFLKRHGLWIVDARRIPTQGGSVRCFVKKDPGTGMVSTRMFNELLHTETTEALDVSRLTAKIAEGKAEWESIYNDAIASGKVICGYGAPAQLTTTFHALGMRRHGFAFIVDDNPLKLGKFTPGEFIPIVSTDRLNEADVCVIFSANFSASIISAHPEFKGEWVVL